MQIQRQITIDGQEMAHIYTALEFNLKCQKDFAPMLNEQSFREMKGSIIEMERRGYNEEVDELSNLEFESTKEQWEQITNTMECLLEKLNGHGHSSTYQVNLSRSELETLEASINAGMRLAVDYKQKGISFKGYHQKPEYFEGYSALFGQLDPGEGFNLHREVMEQARAAIR